MIDEKVLLQSRPEALNDKTEIVFAIFSSI